MDQQRRDFLKVSGLTATLAVLPRISWAAGADSKKMIVVLLRGGMDGMHLLPPVGDPRYAGLRGALAVQGAKPLDGTFGLHPALPFAASLYDAHELVPVVAIAPPYQGRSHFEAQDCLENGSATPHGLRTGWMARLADSARHISPLSISNVQPLTVQGTTRIQQWSPPLSNDVDDALLRQLAPLYARDTALAMPFRDGMMETQSTRTVNRFGLAEAMQVAAEKLSAGAGLNVAFVDDTGWDTHRGQAAALTKKFAELDTGLAAARKAADVAWRNTVVVVVTEFGRTAAANGTGGTDHGTGGVALLAGGAVKGGHIAGDWRGLGPNDLFEQRDIHATTDMRALFASVLLSHMQVSESTVISTVFPGVAAAGVARLTALAA